jgi:signal transduction histidine kinase
MLPPITADEAHGLYFPRIGNQFEVYVGNQKLMQRGVLGDSKTDSAKAPLWLPIAATMLSHTQATTLRIEISAQASRWGGLAAPSFGLESEIYPVFRTRYVWRQWGTVAVIFSLSLMGVVAAGLWWLQRERLYAIFALAALLGDVRYMDRLLEQPPLPWPLWGGVAALALAAHILLMTRFVLDVLGKDGQGMRRVFYALLGLELVCVVIAFGFGVPLAWSIGLALLIAPACAALFCLVHSAWKTRSKESLILAAASAVVLATGLRDFFAVRLSADGPGTFSVLHFGTIVFVLLLGWIIISRYSSKARDHELLLKSLDEKVNARETALRDSYAQLQHEHANQATLLERQRIMRDIHDGVGAHLVSLMSLIGKPGTDPQQLKELTTAALDEMRMAVDSIQPVDDDLSTVLATLRYRLQPRLQAAGIAVDWQVQDLPPMANLTPKTVLQIQRILLEAFTNVLRHAKANSIRVHARPTSKPVPGLLLEISDNGMGLQTPTGVGQGVKNMTERAKAIGAALELANQPAGGCVLRLHLPVSGLPQAPSPT